MTAQMNNFYPDEMAENLVKRNSVFPGPRIMYQQEYTVEKASALGNALRAIGILHFHIDYFHLQGEGKPCLLVNIK